jgi:hypothetical protein
VGYLHERSSRAAVHPDHVLTTTYHSRRELLEAACSCGRWTAQQYVGCWHVPADFPSAHAAHVTHALTPKEPAMPKPSPAIAAGKLSSDQIGHTIRLTTVEGVTIEDRLTRVEHAIYGADKEASVRVHFANVQPNGATTASAFLLGQATAFKVHPNTVAAITAGPAA